MHNNSMLCGLTLMQAIKDLTIKRWIRLNDGLCRILVYESSERQIWDRLKGGRHTERLRWIRWFGFEAYCSWEFQGRRDWNVEMDQRRPWTFQSTGKGPDVAAAHGDFSQRPDPLSLLFFILPRGSKWSFGHQFPLPNIFKIFLINIYISLFKIIIIIISSKLSPFVNYILKSRPLKKLLCLTFPDLMPTGWLLKKNVKTKHKPTGQLNLRQTAYCA